MTNALLFVPTTQLSLGKEICFPFLEILFRSPEILPNGQNAYKEEYVLVAQI
jgi:hypothetical protein